MADLRSQSNDVAEIYKSITSAKNEQTAANIFADRVLALCVLLEISFLSLC